MTDSTKVLAEPENDAEHSDKTPIVLAAQIYERLSISGAIDDPNP